VDMEEDSTFHLDHGEGVRPDPHVYHQELGDTSDVLPGNWNRTAFNDTTVPNSRRRNGTPTNVNVCDIRVAGDTIICDVLLTDTTSIAEPVPPHDPAPLAANPNPFTRTTAISFQPTTGGPQSVDIYDAGGRLVRVLAVGREPSAASPVSWDGTDDSGAPLPAGVYLLRLRSNGGTRSTRLVLQR
jgi:hypothetical protein